MVVGRSSHGERGLKLLITLSYRAIGIGSLLPRGAWIETLSPRHRSVLMTGRSSHGERGLKRLMSGPLYLAGVSLLPRGAWIETRGTAGQSLRLLRSLLPRGAWIETSRVSVGP